MIHKPIQLKNIRLSFTHKTCFDECSLSVPYGSRIAIIGRNGSGKTTLLKILKGAREATSGALIIPEDVVFGSVPQVVETFDTLSGGQRFNAALTDALSVEPNVLLLDEPTNHLDRSNRKSLMRLLRVFTGTLIIVSHDVELLRNCIDTLWHIDNGKINVFSGNYDNYMREIEIRRNSMEQELSRLTRQKKSMHTHLMKEQMRASKSSATGKKHIEQRKWPTIVSRAKANRASQTSGCKKAQISQRTQELRDKITGLHLNEIIVPKFSLTSVELGSRTLVSIREGGVGYKDESTLLCNISLSIAPGERVALRGDNGSGKTILIKAILNDPKVLKSGNWITPRIRDIGYLDQHYGTLSCYKSVFETIYELAPSYSHAEIRCHLNDFLFRKNEEVNALVSSLSGGEKARLTMAQIAAKTPKLLILDEMTNNLDLETREHVIQVLKEYPGSMIIISHDEDFLREINISDLYNIMDDQVKCVGCG